MTTGMTEGVATTGPTRTGEHGGVGSGAALMGALLVVVGILCMVAPKISGRASVVVFGGLLGLSGLIQIAAGLRDRGGDHRGMLVGEGLFSLAVGGVMVARPIVGMAALTLLLAAFFFASGLFPLIAALSARGSGWVWHATFGAAAIILGVIVLAWSPISALWLIGTLVGIEIVVRGGTLLASAFDLHPRTNAPAARHA
jgi:uncharacterized membrane protein HdeD (DUF308 family)